MKNAIAKTYLNFSTTPKGLTMPLIMSIGLILKAVVIQKC
jgi:hypothetical protein